MLERFSSKSEITSELFRIIMSVVNTLMYNTSVSSNRALQCGVGGMQGGMDGYHISVTVR